MLSPRRRRSARLAVLAIVAPLAACASRSAQPAAEPAPAPSASPIARAATPQGGSRALAGRFTPMLSNTATIGSEKQRLYGTARVVATDRTDFYVVELSVNSPRGAENLPWSVLPGRCGSGSLPILQPSSMAPVEVRATGSGEVKSEVPMTLSPGAQYHVNLYSAGGSRLEEVIACANLRG